MRPAQSCSLALLITVACMSEPSSASAPWRFATDYVYATVMSCQSTLAERRDIVDSYPPGYAKVPRVKKSKTDPLTVMSLHVHRHPGLLEWYSGDKVYRFWTPGKTASDVISVQATITPQACTNRLLNQTRYFGLAHPACDVGPPSGVCLFHLPLALEISTELPRLDCRLADVLAGRGCDSAGKDGPPARHPDWPRRASQYRYRVKVTACADTTRQRQAWAKHHPEDRLTAIDPGTSLATALVEEADDFVVWVQQRNQYYFQGARRPVHIAGKHFALSGQSPAACRKTLLGHQALCTAFDVNCNDAQSSKIGCAVKSPLTFCMAASVPAPMRQFPCELAQVLATGECRKPR